MYTKFFVRRGYSKAILDKLAQETFSTKQEDLLNGTSLKEKKDRIPLVVNWHHKFSDFSRILQENYRRVVQSYPDFQAVFPHPPMVAFRRQRNLADRIVKSKHWREPHKKKPSAAFISANLCTDELSNPVTGQSFKTLNCSTSTRNVVYATKCKQCSKLYVGSTGQQLNQRFNGHRSDITCHPDRCELPHHFAASELCNFQDLQIHVLEKVSGDRSHRLHREEIWTQKLDAFEPVGLNKQHTEFLKFDNTLHRLR